MYSSDKITLRQSLPLEQHKMDSCTEIGSLVKSQNITVEDKDNFI